MEFSRGLVLLATEKMLADLPEVLFDDHMFCHFIDEALSFQRELHETFDYPTVELNCLKVLTQPDAFHKWLLIERKCEYRWLLVHTEKICDLF